MTLLEALRAGPALPSAKPNPPHLWGAREASAVSGDWVYRAHASPDCSSIVVQRTQFASGLPALHEYRLELDSLPVLDWQPTAALYSRAMLRSARNTTDPEGDAP